MNLHKRELQDPNKLRAFIKMTMGLLAIGSLSTIASAETKVVGYIPTWVDMGAIVDRTDLTKLTHLNLAFMSPTSTGATLNGANPACMDGTTASTINYVVQKAHQAGVKVLVSLAGGGIPSCSGNWETLLNSTNRAKVANNIVQFVNTYGLDGVDVDIEGDLMTRIDNARNYTPFIQALRNGLGTKALTAATGSYVGGMVPNSSIQYFNFINLMSYDAVGPYWGNPGDEHSTYNQAVTDINTWKARGLSKDKMVLGVPAYGYGFNGYAANYNYIDIINQFGATAAQKDLIGTACNGCGYITYNGLPTIRNKTKLAMQEGSGVMIWELSGDIPGSSNILAAVRGQISNLSSSSSSSSSSSTPAFSTTIQAESYAGMNGVQLETTTDTGGGQNVGWIDTGDWMYYNSINIPTSGTYTISFRVASLPGGGKLQFEKAGGGTVYGSVNIPATGGWQTWSTVNLTVTLTAGAQSFGINAVAGGWNLNWIKITKI
jgi:GH18 family chitinase